MSESTIALLSIIILMGLYITTKSILNKCFAGYKMTHNGTNFVWLHKDGNKHEGTLHFTENIDFDKPFLTHGICRCEPHSFKMDLEISKACDVKEALVKFIVANW